MKLKLLKTLKEIKALIKNSNHNKIQIFFLENYKNNNEQNA